MKLTEQLGKFDRIENDDKKNKIITSLRFMNAMAAMLEITNKSLDTTEPKAKCTKK